jgi:hypothetical protein
MRLTIRNSDGSVSQPVDLRWADVLSKLVDYEDAEKRGLLVRLPCKVGDIVYALWSVPTPTKYVTYLAEVKEIRIAKRASRTMLSVLIEPVEFRGRRKEYFADDFGKLVFRTEEEAEAALKGEKKAVASESPKEE